MRPVVEMQFDAFAYPAFEQIVSHVAKMHNRTKGRVQAAHGHPDPVRRRHRRSGAPLRLLRGLLRPHRRPEGLTPATVADGYRLLREAIDSDDPVVFMEPKKLYLAKDQVDTGGVRVPPIEARGWSRRPGTDATLIAYGPSVPTALAAAAQAATGGPRRWTSSTCARIVPFDDETVWRPCARPAAPSSSPRRTGSRPWPPRSWRGSRSGASTTSPHRSAA